MLEQFGQDLKTGSRAGLLRAARRAYLLALLVLAVPSVGVGAAQWLSGQSELPLGAAVVLAGLAAGLGLMAYLLARRAAQNTQWPAPQAALTGAFQLAGVPGVPLLLAGAFAPAWGLALFLLVLAAGGHLLAWASLDRWVRSPAQDG
ncbi:hypothetical protein K7W42_17425 [Deinococcus sp. HMF7604]|uniref:hypothetical protein n=1 Tax=Deinococcus betulae TaxID=2873312 RepID=UPI001CCE856F|nr:hypothetical protein [Deinococcus betulae]MBZ9752626.1 hypothetical protein [Deinococcus betulae]